MSSLLEIYRQTVGHERVRPQGSGHNGPCPFCGGGASGKRSDRFMVLPGKNGQVGETCLQHGLNEFWYCRQCTKGGDTIAFLMEVKSLSFTQACAELGIKVAGSKERPLRKNTPKPPNMPAKAEFQPNQWSISAEEPELWQEYATKLLGEARESLHKNPQAGKWLMERGITPEAIDFYQLGYLPGEGDKGGRYRVRKALGLAPRTGADGKEKTRIFIPRGITIPHFNRSGKLVRLRIRRPAPDIKNNGSKYLVLEGSSSEPMLLEARGSRHLAAYVAVEAELDAILIHQATGQSIGAFAALTNRGKPDLFQHSLFQEAVAILVALDYDEPREVSSPQGGKTFESAGANGWPWWAETYRQAKRWPVPTGKDPGEAFAQGVDIRTWIAAGLPPCIKLPQKHEEPLTQQTAIPEESCKNFTEDLDAQSNREFPSPEHYRDYCLQVLKRNAPTPELIEYLSWFPTGWTESEIWKLAQGRR